MNYKRSKGLLFQKGVFIALMLAILPVSNLFSEEKSFLKAGDPVQLPGSNFAGTAVDTDGDDVPDGLDFNNDNKPELGLVKTGRFDSMGVDEDGDGKADFYMVLDQDGNIIISSKPGEGGETLSQEKGIKLINWSETELGLAGSFFGTNFTIDGGLLTGTGGVLAFERGLDGYNFVKKLTKGKRKTWMPGFRGEVHYLQFQGNSLLNFLGITAVVGPLWRIPFSATHRGYFVAAPMVGMTALLIKGPFFDTTSITYTMHALGGYRYPFSFMTLFANMRTALIYDADSILVGFGLEAGFSFRIM